MPGGGGRFLIVNAGPGGRGNITLRGLEALQAADLVIASERQRARFAADLAGREVIDGGHGLFTDLALRRLSPEEAARQEDDIRARIESVHAAGGTVVLLESGDAALFSPYRGYLAAFRHLLPELVPGASSFNAANAALGQSLLHDQRHRLQMTGLAAFMEADGTALPEVWVLFCMGLDLPELAAKARALYPPETPVALVLDAGYPECEVIRCRVDTLAEPGGREISFPTCIIYIGPGLSEPLPAVRP